MISRVFNGEFDPGSGRTLAACLTHAFWYFTSANDQPPLGVWLVCVWCEYFSSVIVHSSV
ncbi:hypothetical protein DVG80_31680 [Rhodococcus erythropolis]|nr:hypothetical protein DVG80_31680 [Rhodococcus erythropolis]